VHATLNQRVVGSSPTGGTSVSKRQGTSRSDQSTSFPVFPALATQEHSTLPSRREATDNDQKRPLTTPQNAPQDSDLAVIIESWDRLPEGVRQSVVMLVKAASGK
jgi:hypothetical protein